MLSRNRYRVILAADFTDLGPPWESGRRFYESFEGPVPTNRSFNQTEKRCQ